MLRFNKLFALTAIVAATWCLVPGCDHTESEIRPLKVPKGYLPVLEIEVKDRLLGFGPFVGYYFKPENLGDFTRLKFVCFNERRFYSADIAENAQLFEGQAVLTRLADVNIKLPDANRINPIYFSEAPPQWLQSRPDPKEQFVHFHSCYDSQGPVLTGYWIRHVAMAAFTYDMGGRVGPDSVLYHKVMPGSDKAFARIIEFDRGPG
jgi:hypothetical protein